MHAANNIPHTPDSGQELPPTLKQRIHRARRNPAALTALIRQLCPGLTPDRALAWLVAELTFEAAALEEAAELLNGTWEA